MFLIRCGPELPSLGSKIKKLDNLFDKIRVWQQHHQPPPKVTYMSGFVDEDKMNKSVKGTNYVISTFDFSVALDYSNVLILYILPDVATIETDKISEVTFWEPNCFIQRNYYGTLLKVNRPSASVINSTPYIKSYKKKIIYEVAISTTPIRNIVAVKKQLKPFMTQINTLIHRIWNNTKLDEEDTLLHEFTDFSTRIDTWSMYPKNLFTLNEKKFIEKYEQTGNFCFNEYLRHPSTNKNKSKSSTRKNKSRTTTGLKTKKSHP